MFIKSFLLLRNVARHRIVNFSPIAIRTFNGYGSHKSEDDGEWRRKVVITASVLFSSVLIGSAASDKLESKQKANKAKKENAEVLETKTKVNNIKNETSEVLIEAGTKRPDLPTYRAEDVCKHDSKASFWVTYKHGVYDVTSFLPSHPGGEQIFNAGGLSVEPFWNVYGMHKTPEIFKLLESYRIGNLHDDDVADHSDDELWVREPFRDKRLIVKTAKPFNAEIPPEHQIEHFDTPNELFYVRQHMPVPELQAHSHKLRVVIKDGGGERASQFSLADLSQFPEHTVRAALMCAGNRRSEMNEQVKPVKGISWAGGAVSNARWTGVYLYDVLRHCGVDLEHTEGKYVIFTGADMDATGMNFSTSIPLHMAAEPGSHILLATRMNDADLPPDHGHPLRLVVPGAPAVRSVKWLESITVSSEESPSHWHRQDYRSFNPSQTWETAEFGRAPPVYSLPVTSALCRPGRGDLVHVRDGHVLAKGYAYSGGGAKVLRVDVSTDRGATWAEAELQHDAAPPARHYSWTLWTASLPAHTHLHEMEIWVKATDSNFNTQPEKFDDIWNIRGILSNAYHKIKVKLIHPE